MTPHAGLLAIFGQPVRRTINRSLPEDAAALDAWPQHLHVELQKMR
jgi:hypothetical protein